MWQRQALCDIWNVYEDTVVVVVPWRNGAQDTSEPLSRV